MRALVAMTMLLAAAYASAAWSATDRDLKLENANLPAREQAQVQARFAQTAPREESPPEPPPTGGGGK